MSTMTPMIEYLLALRIPDGGGQLVRFGGMQTTIPIFPPNMQVIFNVLPYYGSYCTIEFWHRFSPAIVPGAFNVSITHVGLELLTGVIGTNWTAEGHNLWVEVTEQNPGQMILQNISGLNQFMEIFETFLLVDSEYNLDYIREVVKNWGSFKSVADELGDLNDLLRQYLGADGPQVHRLPSQGGR